MLYKHRCICFISQLAEMGIMARTVRMLAPQTAEHVYLLTVPVVVFLVGRDPTVVLVFD